MNVQVFLSQRTEYQVSDLQVPYFYCYFLVRIIREMRSKQSHLIWVYKCDATRSRGRMMVFMINQLHMVLCTFMVFHENRYTFLSRHLLFLSQTL